MRKRTAAAFVGCAAIGALILTGCSSSGSNSSESSSPTASPSGSSTASPKTFTKTIGGWKLTLTEGGQLPVGWPNIPAPNNGQLQATGTAAPTETEADSEVLAAQYMAPGSESSVSAAQKTQMQAEGWAGGLFEDGTMAFHKGNESAFITVVGNGSTGGVDVFQWASKLELPKVSESASSSASAK